MTDKKPLDIIEMMDNFAQTIYDTVKPKSVDQPVIVEEMVSAFKELREWAVKRNDIINSEQNSGGAIEQYKKGIQGGVDSVGKSGEHAAAGATGPAAASTGILAQLGTRKKSKRPPRLPSYSEGDSGDSGGPGAEQPVVSLNGSSIHNSDDSVVRSDMAENSGSGAV